MSEPPSTEAPKNVSLGRLLAVSALGFSIPLLHTSLEPAVLGAKVLELWPQAPNTALGGLTFAGLTVAMTWQPLVGALSDRTRTKLGARMPYLILGTALVALFGYAIYLAPSFALLVAAYAGVQAGANTVQGPWQALIPDHVPYAQRGQAAAFKSLFEIVAAVIGRAVAGELLGHRETLGDTAMALAITIPVVALVLGVLITHLGTPTSGFSPPRREVARRSWLAAGRETVAALREQPSFSWWFANRVLFWGALIIVSTFLLFFAMHVLGFSEPDAQAYMGRASAALGGVLLVTVVPLGRLADRVGHKRLVIAGGVIASLGTALVLVTRDPWLVGLLVAVVGLGVGAYVGASWALITFIVPSDDAARFLGIANIATAGASALVRLPAGWGIDRINAFSGDLTTGYLVLFGVASLMFGASSLVALRLPDQRPRR